MRAQLESILTQQFAEGEKKFWIEGKTKVWRFRILSRYHDTMQKNKTQYKAYLDFTFTRLHRELIEPRHEQSIHNHTAQHVKTGGWVRVRLRD